eukprot:CAMPEP_0170262492 /NCGR_PEP_ID=MMETSP0116_2-20130129/31130_1 /TAXON_ID=400756 /ORGANISM="Durinskia baltica, Strain CSIRO CS-38" /LENGTH=679 /DNA_ID=CAMNT_0010513563 /DNA_START=102 /DNA_END=2141 /DNA_ORIENTATION=-
MTSAEEGTDRQQALLGAGGGAAGLDRAGSEDQPGLNRWTTAPMVPWERSNYSSEDLLQWIKHEQQSVRSLFDNPLTVDTPIPKSMLGRPGMSITFKDVSYSIPKPDRSRQMILEPVSGHFEPGELVAIMGPSGCGKSTLLDMLASKKTSRYEGEILINGHKRDHLFQRVAAYVGQEDVMPQHWKVREAVEFNWRLKAEAMSNVPWEIQSRAIDMMLAAFGLTVVANTYIGGDKVRGCSGGQRRRVTLARGVAQRASLLFADEPTSGLSATDAEACVKAMRIIAKKFGVLALVVIHQPRVEVAQLFDKLLLLTANPGRCVYNGPMAEAVAYWKSCGYPVPEFSNPTDFFLDLVTPGGPIEQVDLFVTAFRDRQLAGIRDIVAQKRQEQGPTVEHLLQAQHQQQTAARMGPGTFRKQRLAVSFGTQLRILFKRKLTLTLRNPSAIFMPILMPVFTGVLLGVMYTDIGSKALQQQVSFVFMLLVRICMGGMQLMPQLIEDRTVMKYDTSEGLYSVQAFIIVGIGVDITLSLIGAVLNCIIMYVFSGLNWDYFPMIMEWSLLNFFVFDSFFAMMAAFAPNFQIAQVCAIPFNSIFMMFSGFMISKNSAPSYLRWVFEISPIGYAIQAIFIRMAQDSPQGPAMIQLYGFEDGQEKKGVTIMVIMVIVLRFFQVASLKFRNNIQK